MSIQLFSKGRRHLRTMLLRGAVAATALAISAAVLSDRLVDIEIPAISAALASIPLTGWLAACIASGASFMAVGQYDALFHGWLGTGVPPRRAARSGAASIAVSQFLGFGLVTGTLARWRSLPELSLPDALKVTHYVSISFLAVLGTMAALATWLAGSAMPGAGFFACVAVSVTFAAAVLSLLPQGLLPVAIPPLRLQFQVLALAALDTGCAAFSLWLVLPPEITVGAPHLFAAFLVALAAGFLSGTPGGLGPFEVVLIAWLPQVPEPELLASILAFRMVNHALPACLALLLLARPGLPQPLVHPQSEANGPTCRAEGGLVHLPGHRLEKLSQSSAVTAVAGSSLVVIGDPVCGGACQPGDLKVLNRNARARGYWPALYKVGATSAVIARRQGWHVMAVAEEALVDPDAFSITGPERRQLRRKLRQAEASGLVILEPKSRPFEDMAQVAGEWERRSGGERGFSMGMFERRYVERQKVFLARHEGRLVAFVTFHTAPREWTLDLMRSADSAPSGVMHALVAHAIAAAAQDGIARLSLAAMPLAAGNGPVALVSRGSAAAGLRRFKESFAPRTERLYFAAPAPLYLAVAAVGILMSIAFPSGMRPAQCCNAALRLVRR